MEIGAITDQKVLQLYHQNPTFGFYLFRLALQRMFPRPLPPLSLSSPPSFLFYLRLRRARS